MKKLSLKQLSTIACIFLTTSSFAQNWLVDGNTNAQLGGSLTPSLGTNQNRPLLFETNSIERMRIIENLTTLTTNAAGNINKSGFIGINTTDPWSRLTLFSGTYAPCGGYRQWHREGINIQTEFTIRKYFFKPFFSGFNFRY